MKNPLPILLPVCAVMACVAASSSRAATIAEYVFADNYTNSAILPAGIQSAGTIAFAGGLSGGTGISTNPDNTVYVRSTVVGQTTVADAITADDYFSFQVTIAAGFALDLTSVTLDHWISNTYTSYLSVFYTTGGTDFSSEAVAVNLGEQTANTTSPVTQVFSGNLSGNESLTGTVTFHFLFRDPASTNNTTFVTRLDNITLDGVVSPIPEPSVAALAVGSLLCLALRRRL